MSQITKQGSYHLSIYDNEISKDLQLKVTNFLLDSEYCVNFYDPGHSFWYPRTDEWKTPRMFPSQPRLPLAWDEFSLQSRAPIIYDLWNSINLILSNRFILEGLPEGMKYMTGISPLSSISGQPNCGWRIYGSGNERELRARTKSIHRDSPFLDDDKNFSIVYFANEEWYPQYYGETLFHSDDAKTGDYTGRFEHDQTRNFPIGEVENVVTPQPGRFMLFDSRYLHQIKPAAHYAQNILGIVFRVKVKD